MLHGSAVSSGEGGYKQSQGRGQQEGEAVRIPAQGDQEEDCTVPLTKRADCDNAADPSSEVPQQLSLCNSANISTTPHTLRNLRYLSQLLGPG